jgi:hypothetical protein
LLLFILKQPSLALRPSSGPASSDATSTLTLLVLRVDADHAHNTLAADDLALVTDLLHRRPYLHRKPLL